MRNFLRAPCAERPGGEPAAPYFPDVCRDVEPGIRLFLKNCAFRLLHFPDCKIILQRVIDFFAIEKRSFYVKFIMKG